MLAQTIGHYRIQEKIGSGGMGEVYRATDSRLDREVAVKVLPEEFARDAERMARFHREAKVLASLNHPNIAAIYGLEESNSARALIMELVRGPTLCDRIKQGPLPPDETLPIAKQIAEGLEYAHERGIVHRDLKPSNVKLRADGQAKILDFGLAKALQSETAEEELQNSPTLSAAATRAGVLLGTAAYMSPEQARGKRVDRRTDIWAFGCVLYEMLTGKAAFEGETISDTLAAVIRAEPDFAALPASTPPLIRELLRRCLQKDPRQRLQAIGEARITIDESVSGRVDETGASTAAARAPGAAKRLLPWAAAVLIALALGVLARDWLTNPSESHQTMRLSIQLPEALAGTFSANPGSPFAFSPDGTHLVFAGSPPGKPSQLYARPLDQQTAAPIAGTEDALQPFFSPDGHWIGFFANGRMRKVSIRGGPVSPLCDAPVPHGASWASDGTIVYAPNFGSGLMRISSAGGNPYALTIPGAKDQEVSHRWPQVLPGGKAVLFTIQVATQTSYDDARIAVLSLETGKWRTLVDGGSYARYVPSGHIVYARAGALMALPFDVQRLVVTGTPVRIEEGVVTTPETSGSAEYDVTSSGMLAYVPGTGRLPERSLVWVDRQGVAKELPAPLKVYTGPRISPDGKLVAIQVTNVGVSDIWIYEFARNTLTRLTFGPGNSAVPLWTPDGQRILYRSITNSVSFRLKSTDGTGKEEVILKELNDPVGMPLSVSPDGKTLLFGARKSDASRAVGIEALSLNGDGKVQTFVASTFDQFNAQFSPDGRWVAYMSNESGRNEIYVQPFPGPGGKWMISTDGGANPRWARNGREIFFRNDDKMMSVPVNTQPAFKAGTSRLLFQDGSFVGQGNYDVSPDGQHFLMIREKESSNSPKELNVVLNWSEELKRLASSGKQP
jgi:serine/threonine protein kinase/Tol biopolymer transport system component